MASIDDCLTTVFTQAIRIRCGWHIIDRGWKRNVDQLISYRHRLYKEQFSRIKRTIQCWMYTWMRKGLQSKDEYEIFKCLFLLILIPIQL